jgi:hypothetical protein
MIRTAPILFAAMVSLAGLANGEEYSMAKIDSPAPTGKIAPEITSLLEPTGFKVVKGGSQTVVELWLAKEWAIAADAKTGGEVMYPFTVGQLIGVANYPKKAADFRDQDVPAGTYVIRYTLQPVDGAHVGTSPTRDFFALLPGDKDRDPKTIDYKTLIGVSKETTGTAHPAILSLQKPGEGSKQAVQEISDKEWVVVHFAGKAKQGAAAKDFPVDLVVVGKAAE